MDLTVRAPRSEAVLRAAWLLAEDRIRRGRSRLPDVEAALTAEGRWRLARAAFPSESAPPPRPALPPRRPRTVQACGRTPRRRVACRTARASAPADPAPEAPASGLGPHLSRSPRLHGRCPVARARNRATAFSVAFPED